MNDKKFEDFVDVMKKLVEHTYDRIDIDTEIYPIMYATDQDDRLKIVSLSEDLRSNPRKLGRALPEIIRDVNAKFITLVVPAYKANVKDPEKIPFTPDGNVDWDKIDDKTEIVNLICASRQVYRQFDAEPKIVKKHWKINEWQEITRTEKDFLKSSIELAFGREY